MLDPKDKGFRIRKISRALAVLAPAVGAEAVAAGPAGQVGAAEAVGGYRHRPREGTPGP